MESISLESQVFNIKTEYQHSAALSLSKPVKAAELVVQVDWKQGQITEWFGLRVVYHNRSNDFFRVDYTTLNFKFNTQRLFLSEDLADEHAGFMCTYLKFEYIGTEPLTQDEINLNIKAFEFDKGERQIEISRYHSLNPPQDLPDHQDEI